MNYPQIKTCLLLLLAIPAINLSLAQAEFELIGNKGCRGLMPENTFPGFMHAVELGVTTINMDVVLSADGRIVLSSVPWISSDICAHPDGTPVTKKEESALNIYTMDYAEIQNFDCGKRYNAAFPNQQKINANKPTLKMVTRMTLGFAEDQKYTKPKFNIEIKSDPKWYNKYQPEPQKLVEQITTVINHLGIADVTTLQSTDLNVLEALNKIPDHTFAIGYVVPKGKNFTKNLSKLTFTPDVYSPSQSLVSESLVTACHEAGIRVIPWTINTKADLVRMKSFGCDGAFTDFPDVVR